MSLPDAQEARPYYQAAKQRFADALLLLNHKRTTGAVYLSGYSVECILKALILANTPKSQRGNAVSRFRGAQGHDFHWLRKTYHQCGGPEIPAQIGRAFAFVNTWAVDIRYQFGTLKHSDAALFLQRAEQILIWAEERM